MFNLSSISSGLEFWSVNHMKINENIWKLMKKKKKKKAIYENSESEVFFLKKNFFVKYLIIDQVIC